MLQVDYIHACSSDLGWIQHDFNAPTIPTLPLTAFDRLRSQLARVRHGAAQPVPAGGKTINDILWVETIGFWEQLRYIAT